MSFTVSPRCTPIGSKRLWSLCSSLLLLAVGCSDSSSDTPSPTGAASGGSSGSGVAGSGNATAGASGGTTMAGGAGSGGAGPSGNDSAVCASATFCDDFEAVAAGQAPAAPWTVSQTNATVAVDNTRAFRGTQSVKSSTVPTVGGMPTYKRGLIGLAGAPVIPLPEQRVYGRMMFYLESSPSTNVHWTFIDGTGLVAGQDYTSTYRYGGQLPVAGGNQLMANYDTTDYYATPSRGPQTDCYRHANAIVVPVGKWSCAEWFFDGQANQMRFWLDGTELTDLQINQTGTGCVAQPATYVWQAPVFSRINVGWESYQADDARSIWIDDVVISQTQVGCPAAP
ncbi:MAG: hypothetical protein RL685_7684 [Pseudomonadota bacterium]